MATPEKTENDQAVPDSVIPHGHLPPLRYRDLPEPVPMRRMVGPGIILAGLALGSGEFILWPKITFHSGFVFFWACLLGVTTQYFLNMEITRWSLATGESVITGFCRMSRRWAPIFLLLCIVPWMFPGWAKAAAQMLGWLIWGDQFANDGWAMTGLSIGGLLLCGAILTAGPVVYETVEKIQFVLVGLIIILVIIFAVAVVRPDAIAAQLNGAMSFGFPKIEPDVNMGVATLLGAIAFAGVGGALNLGQSNYVKDKGYGMGQYIGRITSPITGQEEAVSEIGYHFPPTEENMSRWKRWWRAASIEHFFSFYVTCLICLVLLTLISYSIFYEPNGSLIPKADRYQEGMDFIRGEARYLDQEQVIGPQTRLIFLVMGIALLLTTEFGILDAVGRISTDLVKVNWLRESRYWSESRLYYVFLWGLILLGSGVILLEQAGVPVKALTLVILSAALNGAVMFLYSILLLVLNFKALPQTLRASWWRVLILIWSVAFFGIFTVWVGYEQVYLKVAAFFTAGG
ncbi:MAG: Nramp family divalent metal transporter [Pirellulales bacterium]